MEKSKNREKQITSFQKGVILVQIVFLIIMLYFSFFHLDKPIFDNLSPELHKIV